MGELIFDPDPFADPPPDPVEPEGGWKKPCTIADHRWQLFVEDGRASLHCVDPHPESFVYEVDPNGPTPTCIDPYWVPDDIYIEGIPVTVKHVDDSTPSTPAGPAEYGYHLEIEVDAQALASKETEQT